MSSVSSYNAVHATQATNHIMAYRAEFNVMSGRWMVLNEHDVCYSAGMSEAKAKETALALNTSIAA